MTAILLRAARLERRFGAFRAVTDVDLQVAEGSVHSVIGPNGAGKTTLFRLLTGILRPTGGSIEFAGHPIGGRPPHVVARHGLAQTFQTTNIFPRLTVYESVQAALVIDAKRTGDMLTWFHRGTRKRAAQLCESVGLGAALDTRAGALSHGDQRALEVALALATRPRLLLLDEPTAGMSPFETRRMVDLVTGLARDTGLTVLFSEHDMDTVFAISDRVTVLHQGRVIADGPSAEVRADHDVMAVYLGSEVDA